MKGRRLVLKLTMFILVGVVCLVVKRATMLGRGCQERTVVHQPDTILHKATHSCSSCVWSLLWYISEGQYDILCPVVKALYLLWNKGEIQCKASYFWPRPCLQGWGAEAPDSSPALLKWRTCTRLDCTEWWHDHFWFFFLPHQFDNISNRRAHFETTGPEIWQQTEGRVDAVTFSTGTGGTIAGKQQTQRPLLTTTVLKINNPFLA